MAAATTPGLSHPRLADVFGDVDVVAEEVGTAELRALASIDDTLPPEHVEAEHAVLRFSTPSPDALRLPLPSVRASDGDALFRAFSGFVARMVGSEGLDPAFTGLVLGIHDLEREIRERAQRHRGV